MIEIVLEAFVSRQMPFLCQNFNAKSLPPIFRAGEIVMIIDRLLEKALQEDIGTGDVTSGYLNLENSRSEAYLLAKEKGILAGLDIAVSVFRKLDPNLNWISYKKDGDPLRKGDEIIKLNGMTNAILNGERVALNFLQRMSGIATMTGKMVEIISPYQAKLLDTRKTTPLHRELEKYAVRIGGGYNHRFGLYDMIMIKDNHIQAAGSITAAVQMVRKNNVNYKIEVEVKNLRELREAVKCRVDRIMLDNMSLKRITKAVNMYGDQVELEVSGGINLDNIRQYAETGVHFISVGSLTHSFKALDISLLFR
jgi:nicotinate-nucleotide pyrophosphorylase (carboxylating)